MSEVKEDIKNDGGSIEFNPKINVGIDFGTDGTGIAYSLVGDKQQRVYIYDKWKIRDSKGKNIGTTSKVRTAILLNKKSKVMNFGVDALTSYVCMCIQDL